MKKRLVVLIGLMAACGDPDVTYLCTSELGAPSDPEVWCELDEACLFMTRDSGGPVLESVYECVPDTPVCPERAQVLALCPSDTVAFCEEASFEASDGLTTSGPLISCQ